MFTSFYFYSFLLAFFFSSRKTILTQFALFVFLILGFFLMPHWYDPIIMFVIANVLCLLRLLFIPITSRVPELYLLIEQIETYVAPILTGLTYCDFFFWN